MCEQRGDIVYVRLKFILKKHIADDTGTERSMEYPITNDFTHTVLERTA